MNTVTISNPILRGFNPDPTIVRVGDEYFIATSTFEWFPAIRLHRSVDLVNWTTIGHAVTTSEQLDLRGIPDSGGVWAPSLSWSEGKFWLMFSVIRTMDGPSKDLDNYLMTAPSITGPWSEPRYLGSRGFDFSAFHDTDGTHWAVGLQWDARPDHNSFAGLVLQQLGEDGILIEPPVTLLRSQSLIEGPNLYQHDGWYYLLYAEGGTGWEHRVSIARSRRREGPYENYEHNPVLTSRGRPELDLQKAGHGELVEGANESWFLVHLASRPVKVGSDQYCILGRETCLQAVEWTDDGWLRLAGGDDIPKSLVPVEPFPTDAAASVPPRDDFDAAELDTTRFSTLRIPLLPHHLSLSARPGWVRLSGSQSTASTFEQAMLAERLVSLDCVAETLVDARPTDPAHAAGLVLWYDRRNWVWAQVTWAEDLGRHLRLVWRDLDTVAAGAIAVDLAPGPVTLRCVLIGGNAQFSYLDARCGWSELGDAYPAWKLSDDYADELRFTGAFAGIRAEDLNGTGWFADFDYFDLRDGAPR